MTKNRNITALNELGQSIWYDNLSRDVLRSGELAKLIASGVSGLTSNPTIFKKAIADTADYDNDVRTLVAKGVGTEELCEELMIRDVASAADLLKPIFEASKGADGYASIEVSPTLARNTQGTVDAAKRIWGKLARPNIMIKIPATSEGIPAIREVLTAGINVNVTLIFSSAVYVQVAEAYLAALESRAAKGEPISTIASVASFFVSRVDAICEKAIAERCKAGAVGANVAEQLFGRVGIANSKAAYAEYERLFKSARFEKLRAKGARVQRPLWASTGTKNPKLSPVLYIEELAGADTVNTLPPATLNALLENATIEPRLHNGLNAAREVLGSLATAGVYFDELLARLQEEGVKSFADSYAELLGSIETKRAATAAQQSV